MEKRAFKRIGGAVLSVGVFWTLTSYLPRFIWDFSFESMISNDIVSSILSFVFSIVMYIVATLTLFLFLRGLPTLVGEPKKKMKLLEFLAGYVQCVE